MSNFSRYDEFHDKLHKIAEITNKMIIRNNGAIIVSNTAYRSMGVTRMLANYYKPDEKQTQELNTSNDKGKSLAFMSQKYTVDKETYSNKFLSLSEKKFSDQHDSFVVVDEVFKNLNIISVHGNEFQLGHKTLFIREYPNHKSQQYHLTGAIDYLKYNTLTGKLVIIELKTGKYPFGEMKSLYLKEKHVKQVQMYAWMLRYMSICANIPIRQEDIELMIVAVNDVKKMVSVWKVQYDPITFLGKYWNNRWSGIIDTGFLFAVMPISEEQQQQQQQQQQQLDNSFSTKSLKIKKCVICKNIAVFEGKIGNMTLYFCSHDCKNKLQRHRSTGRVRRK